MGIRTAATGSMVSSTSGALSQGMGAQHAQHYQKSRRPSECAYACMRGFEHECVGVCTRVLRYVRSHMHA
eukprot:309561-Pelagomonas_calceolata.AAC.1